MALAGTFAALSGSAAQAAIPATAYNGPLGNYSKCIPIRDNTQPVEVYLSNGGATGYSLTGAGKWPFTGKGKKKRRVCQDGELRIQPYETLSIAGQPTYYVRGGDGRTNQDGKLIRPGHVAAGDLRNPPVASRSPGKLGRRCSGATKTLYRNNPIGTRGTIPLKDPTKRLYYKKSRGGSKWGHYGDPAQEQGSFVPPDLHWNYLLWNWMTYDSANADNPGGAGQGRASMAAGEYIRRCDDVASITSPAYDAAGKPVGEVRGAYGYIRAPDRTPLYGWFAHSWRLLSWGDTWSYLVTPASPSGGDPPG